ncbi:MAG: protein translocase subunit SecD [Chloroflexota bacterium]|nr:protein translocase subunit SecD [Chloroflexota bacterium]MDE3192740.1 protein translocase subunit SecD [Chloroflexota bacterium]
MGIGPWLIALIAVVAVWVDIPHHRVDFPFGCPGICFNIGGSSYQQEIKTHLGLDLQGGTELVLRLETEKLPPGVTTPVSTLNDQARGVIERRINGLGVSEPVIQAQGTDKILVQLPGVSDLQQAQDIVTKQAFLEFKVPDAANAGQYKSLTPALTGANLKPTYVSFQQNGEPVVNFEFGPPDDQRWVDLSKQYVNQQVQIVLDGKQISAPVIQQVFTSGKGIIQGSFTPQSAKELSLLLNSGALPVPLEILQSSRVEPTLGAESVQRSLVAGAIGLLLVALFMILYYRLPGALAVIALIFYTVLTYAVFRLVPVTLTLAGIAGFILSIGMAVDANVLTFERLKEELRSGKSLRAAVEEGRKRAFPSIWYSNLATIITAFILFQFGTGEVKGFALTLGIGVAVSFFTAVVVTQMLLRGAIEVERLRRRPLYGVEERAAEAGRLGPAAVRP